MIKLTHLSIAVAIGITLTACGGGGSSETQANQVTRYTKQVTVETTSTSNDVVPLANATVCLDINRDGLCASDDILTSTDSSGVATLAWTSETHADIKDGTSYNILAQSSDNSELYVLPMDLTAAAAISGATTRDASAPSARTVDLGSAYLTPMTNLIVIYAAVNNLPFTTAASHIQSQISYTSQATDLYANSLRTGSISSALRTLAVVIGSLGYKQAENKQSGFSNESHMFDNAYTQVKNGSHDRDTLVNSAKDHYANGNYNKVFQGPDGSTPVTNEKPAAKFSFTSQGLAVTFANQSSDKETAVDDLIYAWTFGDTANSTSSEKNPLFTYPAAGTYTVKLAVTDADGATDETYRQVTVQQSTTENQAPTAAFTYSVSGQTVVFTNQSSDPEGDALTYRWDFAGLATSDDKDPVYTFPALDEDRNYLVTLTISDGTHSVQKALPVTIAKVQDQGTSNTKPTAAFTYSGSSTSRTVQFANQSVDKESTADNLHYLWHFGDKAGSTSTAKHPSFTYSEDGTFTVSLQVTDEGGLTSTTTSQVKVALAATENTAPVAGFHFNITGNTVVFTDSSSDADGDTLTYQWNFGGQGTSTVANPVFTFPVLAVDKTYSVTLTVNDGKASHQVSRSVTIAKQTEQPANNPPVAAFTWSLARQVLTITANQSSDPDGDSLTYLWSFGDGTTSTAKTPSHTYANAAKRYTVTLVVSDGRNGTASHAVDVDVTYVDDVAPTASFKNTVNGLDVSFTATATDNVSPANKLVYSWDFGDGTKGTGASAAHSYLKPGSYQVSLVVTDEAGNASAPVIHQVTAVDKIPPTATLTKSVDGMTVTLTAHATDNISSPESMTYVWAMGDGSTRHGREITYTYQEAKTYSILLTVTDEAGNASTPLADTVTVTDSGRCTPVCSEKEICDSATTTASSATVTRTLQQSRATQTAATAAAVSTTYHATNPNGQLGKNKTITSMSDWTTDMIVAQSAANDDPRAYRGGHEKATDFYALYAAWDTTNLYVMVEMPNLDGATACGDFDYACDQFLPMGIGIRTGKRVAGNGLLATGNNVWTSGSFYQIAEGIDTLLMFHPRLPTVNTPGIFFTNSSGTFSYDSANGYLMGFDKAGITRKVESGTVSKAYYGIAARNGRTPADYLLTSTYSNLLTGSASGRLYQVTIPLATLGVSKSDIETSGLGLMTFSTFGESMMDALPWTPNLVDSAIVAYSKDESTSHEKEDFDSYDVPLAKIGNVKGGLDSSSTPVEPETPTTPSEPSEPVCRTEQVCQSVPADCYVVYPLIPTAEVAAETASTITYRLTTTSPITNATYTWQQDGKAVGTGASTLVTFTKTSSERSIQIDVKADDGYAIKTGEGSLSVTVPANTAVDLDGGELLDSSMDNLPTYNPSSCHYDAPATGVAILFHGTSSTVPNIWAYKDASTNFTQSGKWPGDAMTKVDGCENLYDYKITQATSAYAIFSNVNSSERYPADMQPGVQFTSSGCFDWTKKQMVDISACLSLPDPTLKVYTTIGEKNGIYTFKYDADKGTGAYLDIPLIIYGEGVTATTEGTVTVNGATLPFRNGQILRLGASVAAADTAAGDTPMPIVVTLAYQNVSATYTYHKVLKTATTGTAFSWDNAYVYFVMTDRFANGDTSNDNSYGRPTRDPNGKKTATFHGGDIKGLTAKLDYLKSLGMNAVWITAPYEQAHGWTGGGSSGAFPHYAYHGYYLLDTTAMDANMGTVEEFRTFVTEAHKRGIRVVLDIVMNHSGYATLKDMCEFNFGATTTGGTPCSLANWTPGSGETWHNKPISETQNSAWNNWWGKNWILFGGYGENCGSGDGLDSCIAYLPDFKNTNPNGSSVSIPGFLQSKWATWNSQYDIPAARPYRSGNMSLAQFQANWLAAWVREFGIDGFRADTAKHVSIATWKLLKDKSQAALQEWRANTSVADDPAAGWSDDFWMTGEHWGYKTGSASDSYFANGGFNSMINFSFNSNSSSSCNTAAGCCSLPTTSTFQSYADMFNSGSGNKGYNALSYVSSHDTSLCRPSGKAKEMGTMLALLPGGVQVYYGDETYRANDNGDGLDYEHGTRSDMNFPSDIANQTKWTENIDKMGQNFSSNADLAHWQKVGQFRMRNVAVGAGKQTSTSNALCRSFDNGDIANNVVIMLNTTSGSSVQVDVGTCFTDGTRVQDGYTGATATVTSGKAQFTAGGPVVLIEEAR